MHFTQYPKQFYLITMQFAQFILTSLALAAVVISAPVSNIPEQKSGIMGDVCDEVTDRFFKFGQCIAAFPQFQRLNQTFWYQAAKKELCGYEMQLPEPLDNSTSQNTASVAKIHNKMASKTALSRTILDSDVQAELQAEYLFLMRNANQTATSNETETAFVKRSGSTTPIFGEAQCLNACDIVRQGSNAVDACWQVTGLTVLYGVCEVGCRYYF